MNHIHENQHEANSVCGCLNNFAALLLPLSLKKKSLWPSINAAITEVRTLLMDGSQLWDYLPPFFPHFLYMSHFSSLGCFCVCTISGLIKSCWYITGHLCIVAYFLSIWRMTKITIRVKWMTKGTVFSHSRGWTLKCSNVRCARKKICLFLLPFYCSSVINW